MENQIKYNGKYGIKVSDEMQETKLPGGGRRTKSKEEEKQDE